MMDDHETLSAVRIELNAALQCLLKPEIMDTRDFRRCRAHTEHALVGLDMLIDTEPTALPDDIGTRLLKPFLRVYFAVVRR